VNARAPTRARVHCARVVLHADHDHPPHARVLQGAHPHARALVIILALPLPSHCCTQPIDIIPLMQRFNNRKWERFNSEKVCSISYARIQGRSALVQHFQNSSLMHEDKRCRCVRGGGCHPGWTWAELVV